MINHALVKFSIVSRANLFAIYFFVAFYLFIYFLSNRDAFFGILLNSVYLQKLAYIRALLVA